MKTTTKRPRGRPRHADLLTPAEWRTVHAIQHGLSTAEIASRRRLSVNAIKFHLANVYAKVGIKDRRGLRAWFRAPRDSALAIAAPSSTGIESVGQIARSVSDLAVAEAWYRDVLGLPHLYTFDTLAFFDCGGTRVMLSAENDGAKPESILYLRVGDIAAAHAALTARGAKFSSAPHLIHRHANGVEEWMAFLEDSDARPLAIMSQVTR